MKIIQDIKSGLCNLRMKNINRMNIAQQSEKQTAIKGGAIKFAIIENLVIYKSFSQNF